MNDHALYRLALERQADLLREAASGRPVPQARLALGLRPPLTLAAALRALIAPAPTRVSYCPTRCTAC